MENNKQNDVELQNEDDHDYSKRGQWLRAAILGANDDLLSTASLMMGIGAVREDVKTMILTGAAGLVAGHSRTQDFKFGGAKSGYVAGACSMAIGEFVSVYSQYDVEMSQLKRDQKKAMSNININGVDDRQLDAMKEKLPNPLQAAAASAAAFSVGAGVPLLAASFIRNYRVRLGAVVAAVSLALVVFGAVGAVIGKSPPVRSTLRVLIGGWVAMGITFGLTKLIGSSGL